MQAKVTKSEAKSFIRAIQDTVEKVSEARPGQKYRLSMGTSFADPVDGVSGSEVKSLLSKLDIMINQYPELAKVLVAVDIQESQGVDFEILKGTKERYEASQGLQEGIKEVSEQVATKKIEAAAKRAKGAKR